MALFVNSGLKIKKRLVDEKESTDETITTDEISSTLTINTVFERITRRMGKWALLMGIVILVFAAYHGVIRGASMAALLMGTSWGALLIQLAVIFMVLAFAELAWRIVLVFMYKPIESCEDDLLPACTVIVPAFNEGRQVFLTLESLAASDYPKDKVKLIAVDDGSVDDTWKWIKKAKKNLGEQIITIKQPCNKGKRHALYAGFQQSTGEILITVDSDSIVDTDTLRNMVAPFVADKKVGAVAGNVRVLNMNKGIIPKMLDVIFVYSFDFMRASQSMVKAVMCTPGALSAYRRSVVMVVLHEWLNQKFCGKPANIGEDRAMTNLILREGHHVLFQQNARVYTEAPVKYVDLCKMYLRWARSNVRETIAMTRFIFKPFREGSKLGARINLISGWMSLTKNQLFLLITWALIFWQPMTFGVNTMIGVIISSSLASLIYAWKFGTLSSLWSFVYGFYFFISLFWIKPYALMTPHKAGWLTRQIKVKPAIPQKKMFLQKIKTAA